MTSQRRCLQLDLGNSGAKWRLVADGAVLDRGYLELAKGALPLARLPEPRPAPDSVWVSSVAAPAVEEALAAGLRDRWRLDPWFARTAARSGDLVNSYADPGRMGVDRWLAMLGARARSTDRLCVVDAGSALTIDIVAADGRHEGGYILPGALLMERALLLDTDRVRFDEKLAYTLAPGRSTAEAVGHGIALAQAGAVVLALDRLAGAAPALLFCGGGGETLQGLVGRGGELAPDLVFEGLECMAQGAAGD